MVELFSVKTFRIDLNAGHAMTCNDITFSLFHLQINSTDNQTTMITDPRKKITIFTHLSFYQMEEEEERVIREALMMQPSGESQNLQIHL